MAGPLRFGGDYNPEQWPRPVWEEDVRLMVEAGVNLVTLGVFSWAMLEPREGQYEFDWLRDVLDLLSRAGIGVDLATPTASPPPWVAARYPGTLPVDEAGLRYWPGSRQHFCVCSPDYRRLARNIVERLAKELGRHQAVEMWHIHNEYGCHVPYCYCDHHEHAFQSWLEVRYGSVGALNDAWGTAFWSQHYADFSEVAPPRRAPTVLNPSQVLDYLRFCNEAFLEEMLEEREILKRARPDLPATTNFMGPFKPLDYFAWARELDFVSTDNHLDPAGPEHPMESALHYDLVRSLNKSVPWMVMEQTSAHVNWRAHNVPKRPGSMRALSYQAVARGAGGVLFFQWRASRAGAEKFQSAMLGHAGSASPTWAEVAMLGRELEVLEVEDVPVESKAAICFSWPSWWALEGQGQPAHDLLLVDQLHWVYGPLFRSGVAVDFCQPGEELGHYGAVVVPSLYLLDEADGQNLVAYVESGGTAVISFWSGIVDAHDHVYGGPYGGPLRGLFGGDVVEVAPMKDDHRAQVAWADGSLTSTSFWVDRIIKTDGDVLARLDDGPYAGGPVVVASRRGGGSVLYVGSRLDEQGMERVYSHVPALWVPPDLRPPPGVERVVRRGDHVSYEFLMNHSDDEREVAVATGGRELLSGTPLASRLKLGPQEVAVVLRTT